MKTLLLTFFSLVVTIPIASAADCIYNGKPYPPGTDIGGLICQPDGTWKPRQ